MRSSHRLRRFLFSGVAGSALAALFAGGAGCGGATSNYGLLAPFLFGFSGTVPEVPDSGGRPGGGTGGGGGVGGGSRAPLDPCEETQSRKFVRISMRNQSEDFIHYFLLLIARIDDGTGTVGSVCPDDVDLYTNFGYILVPEGQTQEFGSVCIEGPALTYFHRNGQFRAAGGAQFASAIAPASGATPTFDAFFTSSGAQVPVPDEIIFQNPGSGEGAQLQVSQPDINPCGIVIGVSTSICNQDSFYYVDDQDLFSGSAQLGLGSGRRVASEIQGTGCQCRGITDPAQILGPSGATANNALCNEFLRGGTINYVFLRDDQNPPFPQLVWRVTDSGGAVVHAFDSRAGIQ